MNDWQLIQHTISLYSDGCSRRDWDQVVNCFDPQGTWEVPSRGIVLQGHDVLRAAMAQFVSGFDWFVQMNSPAIITVEGNRASARSTIREVGRQSVSGELLEVMGFYDDELVLGISGWKFTRKVFTGAGLHGLMPLAPALPG